MHTSVKRKLLSLALTLLFSGCSDVLSQQVDLSDASRAISFFSDRNVRTEYGVSPGRGIWSLLLVTHDGEGSAYLKGTTYVYGEEQIAWSQNGSEMVAVAYDDSIGRSCLMLFSTEKRHCLVDDTNVRSPSWSPDGQRISFAISRSGSRAIYILHVSTGELRKLIDLPDETAVSTLTWSPDSKQISYVVPGSPWNYILSVEISSGKPITLTRGDVPAWSPVRNEIAFERSGDIWVYDVDSGREAVFIDDPVMASWPAWSPNGEQLLFNSRRDGNWEIYRINRDGSNLVNLTNNPAWDRIPSWRPISNHNDQGDT